MAFFPTYYVDSVLLVRPEWLKDQGKKAVILDLDNTILPRDKEYIADELLAWVHELKDAGIKVCLVSNSWFRRVNTVGKQLDVPFVDKAVKPLPPAFILGLWKCRTRRKETVVVGDQLFTDVLGATLMGMMSVMVLPLAAHDLKHTLMLRHVEKLIIRDRKPQSSL